MNYRPTGRRGLRADNVGELKPRFESLEARYLLTASMEIGDAEIPEGQSGVTVLSFPVTISEAAPAGGVIINYELVDGEAVAGQASDGGDYDAMSGTVVFDAGETLPKRILVNINPDVTVEGDETFQVQITSVMGDVEVTKDSAVGTILNDDDNNGFVETFRGMGPDDLIDGVDEVLVEIQNAIVVAMDGVADLPVIGPQLRDGVQPVLDTLDSARAALIDGVNAIFTDGFNVGPDDDLIEAFQQTIFSIFGPDGLFGSDGILIDSLDAGNDLSRDDIRLSYGVDKVDDVANTDTEWFQFDFHLGQREIIDLPFEVGADFELAPGLEAVGLTIDGEDGLRFDFRWDLRLGLGLSELYGREAADFFYLNAGAADQTGAPVEEFRATIEVTSAPPKDAAGNDLLVDGRGLQADATFGPLAATVLDAIPFAVDVTAPTGLDTEPVNPGHETSFTLVILDDEVVGGDGNVIRQEFLIDGVELPENELEIPEFLTNLNLKIGEVLGNADDYADVPFPGPVSVTLDFSRINGFRNPDLPTTPSLVFGARLPSISSMTIVGGGEMGFLEDPNHSLTPGGVGGQPDDGRSTGIGFGAGQTSEGDSLVQELIAGDLAPAGGLLLDDASFFLNLDDERVAIKIREAVNRDVASLEDQVNSKSLETLVRNAVNLAVAQKGLAPIEVAVEDGKFVFRSTGTVADPAPTLTIDYSTSQSSKIQVGFTVDIEDPGYNAVSDALNPDQQRFRNRLEKGEIDSASKKTDVFKPALSGGIELKLHASANLDNFTDAFAPSLGFADGELGLPGFEFDFIFDVTAKVATEEVDDDANPGEKKKELKFSKTVETVQFDNVTVDLGGLIESVVIPLSNVLGETLGPVLSLLGDAAAGTTGFLDEPIPILDDIGLGNRSILDLTGNKETFNRFNDAIEDLAGIGEGLTDFLASYNGDPIAMGCYEYDTGDDGAGLLPCEIASVANSSVALEQFLGSGDNTLITDGGVVYDVLQPENIIKLLSGEVADLISLRIPQVSLILDRTFGFNFKSFDANINADAGLETSDLGFVYDTAGMQQIADAFRTGVDPDWSDLLDGFYVANQAGPEVDLSVSLDGGTSVDLSPIISGSLSVELDGSAVLDVFDPNMDDRLRLDEIMEVTNDLADPQHLFCGSASLSGEFDFDAELGEDPLKVDISSDDLGFRPKFDVSLSLDDILSFLPGDCDFGEPILATEINVGGDRVLRLNTGPVYADERLYGDTDDTDGPVLISVRQSGGNLFVSGFGVTDQRYDGPFNRIVGAGGPHDDRFDLTDVNDVPATIDGNAGDDVIRGGAAGDQLLGGLGDDDIFPNAGPDMVVTGAGVNTVEVSAGADTIDARQNEAGFTYNGPASDVDGDTVFGSRFNDFLAGSWVEGFDGDDVILAGTTSAVLNGDRGNDRIFGSDQDDEILGGPGEDFIRAGGGADFIDGGTDDDDIDGEAGNDAILGRGGRDRLLGGGDDDDIDGGSGNDIVSGGTGRDALRGSGGNDQIIAGFGDTLVDGGAGNDALLFDLATGSVSPAVATLNAGGLTVTFDGETLETPVLGIAQATIQMGGMDDEFYVQSAIIPLEIRTGAGADYVAVESTSAAIVIFTDDDNDVVELFRHDADVEIFTGDGTDEIVVNRSDRTAPEEGSVTASSVSGFEIGTATFDGDALETLTVKLGSGDDRVTVRNTHAMVSTEIFGADGDELFTVDAITGSTTIDGEAGVDRAILEVDSAFGDLPDEEFGMFGLLGLTVESLVVDNRENSNPLDWSLNDRTIEVQSEATPAPAPRPFVDAVGADEVVFWGSTQTDENDLDIRDAAPAGKLIRIDGQKVDIRQGENILQPQGEDQSLKASHSLEVELLTPQDTLFSPDGRHGYVRDKNGIKVFAVDSSDVNKLYPSGQIAIPDRLPPGGPPVPDRLGELAISPDGTFLYDAHTHTGITVFSRDAESGDLTEVTFIAPDAAVLLPFGVHASTDAVFVLNGAAPNPERIVKYDRDASTGKLTRTTTTRVYVPGITSLDFAFSPVSGAFYHLYANSAGAVTLETNDVADFPAATIADVQLGANEPVAPLLGVSPLGNTVYIVLGDLLVNFNVSATGELTADAAFSVPGDSLTSPRSDIRFRPNGQRLYIATTESNQRFLTIYDRFSDGRVAAPSSFVVDDALGAGRLEIHPGGNSIHLPNESSNSLATVNVTPDAFPQVVQKLSDGDRPIRDVASLESLVISADGSRAYGVSKQGVLIEFNRDPGTGQLSPDDTQWDGIDGVDGLDGATQLVATSDNVYVLAPNDNAIGVFDIDASGDMEFAGTFAASNATTLGLGTDGATLYVGGNNTVRVLQISSTALPAQTTMFGTGTAVSDFAVNSSHQFLYISKSGANGIQVRRQDAANDYQFVQNYPLADVISLQSSGDGAHLYAGTSDGRLAVFTIQSDGRIQLVEELQNDVGGIRGLSSVDDLAISDDDAYLFAGSADDGTLLVFRRDQTTGALTSVQRLRDGSLGAGGLLGLTSLAITPDGGQLYATSQDGNFGGWSVLNVDVDAAQTAEPVEYRVRLDDAIASLDVYSGGGADVVSVSNPIGIKTSVFTEGGNDNVIVASQPAELEIDSGDGADNVEVRTTSGTSTDVYLRDGQDSITVNGPGIQGPLDIFGGEPTEVTPGDTLTYITGGQATTPSVLTFPNGDVSVDDAENVHYESIEEPPILDELNASITSAPTIDEGDSVDLFGRLTSGVDPRAEWDLNADGLFDDAFGFTATLSWSELQALGLDDDGVYPIALQVYSGRQRTLTTSTLTILNVAPELVAATDPVALVQLEEFDLNLSATDDGDDRIGRWEVTWETGQTPEVFLADAATVQHVYPTSGSKTIAINAYDEDGGPYAISLEVDVAPGIPRERSIAGPGALSEGQSATFTFAASGGTSDAESWIVSFGDGSTSPLNSAEGTIDHTYADDGTYVVSAFVRESDGSVRQAANELIVDVANVAPTLQLGGVSPIDEGDQFTLTLAASDVGQDTISSWQINWGDGTSNIVVGGTTAVPHRYADDGLYTITAIATDEDGSYVAPTIDVTVDNIARHNISGPASVDEDQVYLLELASLDPGDDTVEEWTINWGDGSPVETFNGNRRFVPHVYTGGIVTRTITGSATDEDGTFPTNSLTVDVINVPPMPVIAGASFAREANPYLLKLKSNSTVDTPIVRWEVIWDNVSPLEVVDLDAPSATTVIDYTFPDGLDQATIFATAIDAAGNRYPAAPLDVEIFNIAPTIEVANPSMVDEGSTFTLSLGEITEPAPDTVTDYIIYWGDGEQDRYTVAEIAALGEQVTHEYGDNSPPSSDPINLSDPVTFIAVGLIDEDGTHAAAGFSTVEVLNVAPEVAEFTSDAATVTTKSTDKHVTVTGSIDDVGALDTHVVNIKWGDGSVSEGVPVDPTTRTFTADNDYNNGGVYQITVTAIDDDGGVSAAVTTSAVIQGVGIVDGTLFIVGSNDQDRLEIDYNERLAEFAIDLQLNLDEFGNSAEQLQTTVRAADIDNITAVLCAGDDHFASSVSEDVVGPGDEIGRPNVSILVDGSLGNDEFVVEANSIDAPLMIIGGDNDDIVNVGAGDLDAIELDLQVSLGDGQDSLIVDDRLRLEPTAYDLSPGVVRWDDNPGSPHVAYDDDLESLRVEGGVGADIFTVTPSSIIDVTVDGNAPVTGSVPPVDGDSLFLRTNSTASRRLSLDMPKAGNGKWTFSGGTRDLAFESIERFNRVERLAVAGEAAQDGRPLVKVFDAETKQLLFQFFAYEEDFRDGVRVATGDVDGDGIPDIVVAPGRLHEPLVKVFDGLGPAVIPAAAADANGTGMIEGDDFLLAQRNLGATSTPAAAVSSWEANYGGNVAEAISQASSDEFKLAEFLAYDQDFLGGVAVAVGDVTGDAVNDIVVAPSRGPSEVRTFENVDFSSRFDLFDSFLAYSPSFIGGATVAIGDLTGDGLGDIVTSTGSGAYVNIRVFDGQHLQTAQGEIPIEDFVAFDENVRGGSFVAIGNIVGDFTPDIVLGGGAYAASRVQVFDGANLPDAGTQFASPELEYRLTTAPEENNRAPVRIAVKDYDLDGVADTVFSAQGADGEAQWIREFSPFDQSVVDALFEDDDEFINGFWVG